MISLCASPGSPGTQCAVLKIPVGGIKYSFIIIAVIDDARGILCAHEYLGLNGAIMLYACYADAKYITSP